MDPNPDRTAPSASGGAHGAATQFAADIAEGARRVAPPVRNAALRFGDWLARIGWGKFLLLAALAFIAGGMLNTALFERGPAIVVDAGDAKDRVNVVVSVSPQGIRIAPPAPPAPSASSTPADKPDVQVEKDGVRIVTNKDGKRVELTIDRSGIRVENVAEGAGSADSVLIGPEVLADAEKATEAVDAARERIEELVNEQINRQVARTTRVYREQSSDWFLSFLMMLIITSIIIKVVLGSKRKAESRAQAASATAAEEGLKRQLAEAQLKMMQAQVEPHFLFNTLASVDYLIETDPARASKMQKNLIQYLRAALPQMREGSTTLGKELVLVRAYLEILKVRMDERLQFAITAPQGLASAQFPPMMLQSLVENAIKHALEPKPEGGSITVTADIANGNLRVTVADTGLGFGSAGKPGTGVGLNNVRERLAALYGGRAKFSLEANSPAGTIATIEVPYEPDLARGEARAAAA